jgi:iron(III) transport system permease protein
VTSLLERRRGDAESVRSRSLLLTVAAAMVAALALIPIGYLLVRAGEGGVEAISTILGRPRVWQLTLHSVVLAAAVGAACLVIGTLSGWVLARIRLPGARLWIVLSALPLAVPSYLAAYGWLVAVPSLSGFWPSFLVLTMACAPYVTLPVAAALRSSSTEFEAVARSLGRSPVAVFFSVTWPRIAPAAAAGTLLVILYSLSDFGAVSILRFPTLPWGIHSAYSASFDRHQAALLSVVLVVLAIAVVIGERVSRRRAGVATLRRSPPSVALRWPLAPLLAVAVIPPLLGVALPLAALTVRLFEAETLRGVDLGRLAEATGWTIALAAGTAIVTVLLALPVAALASRRTGRLVGAIESASVVGHAIPGVVIGLSLAFFSLAVVPALYQTTVVLVFAYAVLFLPRALGSVRTGFAAVPGNLLDISRTLGSGRFASWRRVTVPLASPALGIGALLVAISVMKELPATLLLRPTGVQTLATELWGRTTTFEFGGAAPYALVLVLVAAVPAVILSAIGSAPEETS